MFVFKRFYCSAQNEYLIDNFIPSSRGMIFLTFFRDGLKIIFYNFNLNKVDDKRCDCCDGSDGNKKEIINIGRFNLIKKDFYFYKIEPSDIKCPNNCQEKMNLVKNQVTVRLKALNEKKKYLAEGILRNEQVK